MWSEWLDSNQRVCRRFASAHPRGGGFHTASLLKRPLVHRLEQKRNTCFYKQVLLWSG